MFLKTAVLLLGAFVKIWKTFSLFLFLSGLNICMGLMHVVQMQCIWSMLLHATWMFDYVDIRLLGRYLIFKFGINIFIFMLQFSSLWLLNGGQKCLTSQLCGNALNWVKWTTIMYINQIHRHYFLNWNTPYSVHLSQKQQISGRSFLSQTKHTHSLTQTITH